MDSVVVNEVKARAYHFIKRSLRSDKKFIILWGGRNSTKSYSGMQVAKDIGYNTKDNIYWFRKFSVDLPQRAQQPFIDYLSSIGLYDSRFARFNDNNRHYQFPNGNEIRWAHVNKKDSVKGLANVKYAFIDELDQFELDDAVGLFNSLRAVEGLKIICMFNPVDKSHWIYQLFFKDQKIVSRQDGSEVPSYKMRAITERFTIEDNPFATQDDIDELDGLQYVDYNRYLVDRLGEWGSINIEDPFIDGFNYNTHVVDGLREPFYGYDYILGFDFGSTDSCVLMQIFKEEDLENDPKLRDFFGADCRLGYWVIKEYRAGNKIQNIRGILSSIINEFGKPAPNSEYLIYGDNSANSNYTGDRIELINAIEDLYAEDYMSLRPWPKPRHVQSRRQLNWIFRSRNCRVKIHKDNEILIKDLLQVRVNELGSINKDDCKVHDIGHVLDAFRYPVYQASYRDFENGTNLREGNLETIYLV